MAFTHAVVWLDHQVAHVIHFGLEESQEKTIHAAHGSAHLHHKSGSVGSGKSGGDQHFYHEIAQALRGTAEILVTGPANAKQELVKHLEEHDKAVAACVAAVQTLDHPSDGQLLAHARKHFRAADRMLPQQGR
jgi:stalled ribosome rescue protein Dom34